jgi:hypothetical protein
VEVEMKIRGLMMDPITNMPIVILRRPRKRNPPDLGRRLRSQCHCTGNRKGRDTPPDDP